ncbi:hypothetical protein V6259_12800 [Marinomonas sp. TI.3.20]|uniref:hypothetical protein n=1 Tax=Marinomonas sp. TI.3.20 TaxID=3121296 RepID=UPI00311D98A2
MSDLYVIANLLDSQDGSLSFYQDSSILTKNLNIAKKYTCEEVKNLWSLNNHYDLPVCLTQAKEKAIWVVQYNKIPMQSVSCYKTDFYIGLCLDKIHQGLALWLDRQGNFSPDLMASAILITADQEELSKDIFLLPFEIPQRIREFRVNLSDFNFNDMPYLSALLSVDSINNRLDIINNLKHSCLLERPLTIN